MGYNSTGLVEGLAHQTHLQHVNDDGKEVVCVHGHLWSWNFGQLTNGNQHTGQHRPVPARLLQLENEDPKWITDISMCVQTDCRPDVTIATLATPPPPHALHAHNIHKWYKTSIKLTTLHHLISLPICRLPSPPTPTSPSSFLPLLNSPRTHFPSTLALPTLTSPTFAPPTLPLAPRTYPSTHLSLPLHTQTHTRPLNCTLTIQKGMSYTKDEVTTALHKTCGRCYSHTAVLGNPFSHPHVPFVPLDDYINATSDSRDSDPLVALVTLPVHYNCLCQCHPQDLTQHMVKYKTMNGTDWTTHTTFSAI